MSHRPHRSAAQWQKLIDRQAQSSHSAAEFCRRHDLGYASFMQWRNRLSNQSSPAVNDKPSAAVPHFVELTGRHRSSDETSDIGDDPLHDGITPLLIELDLGNGVQLRISRGG